jgi:hypothetical protein
LEVGLDRDSRGAIKLVAALAQSNGSLRRLSQELRGKPEVQSVSTYLYCQEYSANPNAFIEQYVEAEMANGKGLTWALEITWDDREWKIEHQVAENGKYQTSLISFPSKSAESLEELIQHIATATDDLVASTTAIDFGQYSADLMD